MRLWGRGAEPDVAGEAVDPAAVRERSKAEIVRLGGRTIESLPMTDVTAARKGEAVAHRALVLNALANLPRGAPVEAIREYVAREGLRGALTPVERDLLAKPNEALTEQELINASWYDEAIYALAWAGGIAPELPIEAAYPPELLGALPNVEEGESGRGFLRTFRLRPYPDLFAMRDLYYRAHWFTRDGGLNGYDTGVFDGGRTMERRKALEWTLDAATDWDGIELHT